MSASASIEVAAVPLGRSCVTVGVYRYVDGRFEFLPNIRVVSIQSREGPDPGAARFRYVFDVANPSDSPRSFEDAMGVDVNLTGVVQNDERLVVITFQPDGSPSILFDGFAQVPELLLSRSREQVTFLAFGVAVRAWDVPIGGALMRDADRPTDGEDIDTDLIVHFNPQGRPNATPEGADAVDESGNLFPIFLDPLVIRSPEIRRKWTLPMAVRYLCYLENAGEDYIKNPEGSVIDGLLDSRSSLSGAGLLQTEPVGVENGRIEVPDTPATGKAWPNVIDDLIRPHGIGMAFRLETDDLGFPVTRLELFRRQDGSPAIAKDLLLQPRGHALDPAETNLGAARLSRDVSGIANAFSVESELVRYEASFILAPGFSIAAADAQDTASLNAFTLNHPSFSGVNHDKYRLYIFDETGEGHWSWTSSGIETTCPSLAKLLGGDTASPIPYVKRRRVPFGELFTRDSNHKPLQVRLAISKDYAGPQPALWDGTGTWQPVQGGFELLGDRLGIWINIANPNGWSIGASKVPNAPYPAGVVRGIEDQAKPGRQRFSLRLTCVIEGDRSLSATAERRPSSPTQYQVVRRVDARDRYAKHIIAAKSEFNTTSNPVIDRDDSPDAQAEANARRLADEAGEVAGSVTIPRFTMAYRIGDRIRAIRGRGLSMRTNAGAPSEEGEVFPAVVGLTWNFEGKQQTILHLSDAQGERS